MTQRDFYFLIGGSAVVWFLMRNRQATQQPVQVQQPVTGGQQVPTVVNQMPYYNLSFTNSGNMFNPLATEYMPLFGFIATRSYF